MGNGRQTRDCGGCRVCCTTPSIEALNKPAWTPCPHECEAGCSIYVARPDECRGYLCLWAKGELPEWAWPARTKLMVSRDDPAVPAVNVIEAEDGASLRGWGDRLVKLMARAAVVRITRSDGEVVQAASGSSRRALDRYARVQGAAWRR